MSIRERLSGNEAIATAMKQINPDVVAAYPITPSTEIPQYFSSFVANGSVTTEFIPVESEHSAMSACIGASAAGARTMTATSSQGLALMHEVIYIASGMRLPIVLACVNRALSAPINIHNDHGDSMAERDSGWIQLYCENNQEAYDNFIMATRIAEKAMLPVMVCFDGFITSHSVENIELLEDDKVKAFVGNYTPDSSLLNTNMSVGPLDLQPYYFEHRRQIAKALEDSFDIVKDVSEDFAKVSGRKYDVFERYMMDDAEIGIVLLNSTAGTAKYVVDNLREKGIKAGVIKPRVFRPFPAKELAEALKDLKAIAVLDKADGLNIAGAPLYSDITSAMYTFGLNVPTTNYIYGLGGRDVTTHDIEFVFNKLIEIKETGKVENPYNYLGCRE